MSDSKQSAGAPAKSEQEKENERVKIPDAPYYVVSRDGFMSGWGKAEGRVNVCVVPCSTHEEAEIVLAYVKTRPEQKRPAIVIRKPQAHGALLSVVSDWVKTARAWMVQIGGEYRRRDVPVWME